MRSIQVAAYGDSKQLRMADLPVPEPGPGEVLVRLAFAGVNFIDVYMRSGIYSRSRTYETPLPMVLGMEGAGIVAKLGRAVEGLEEGDKVAWCIHRGSYADYATVPRWRLVKIPDDIPLDVATALQLQGCTAHYLTHSAFALGNGHVCLVHAGAGGVGQLLIQIAKMRGAKVIATVGSRDKADIALERGADHAILYREEDFRERVMSITDGRGVDVVYDSVGKETIHKSIHSLARRGLCVNFGAASGMVETIEPMELGEAGSVFFTRPNLADYMSSNTEIANRMNDLFGLWRSGRLQVTIDQVLPLTEAARAHEVIEGRETRGKLLLQIEA